MLSVVCVCVSVCHEYVYVLGREIWQGIQVSVVLEQQIRIPLGWQLIAQGSNQESIQAHLSLFHCLTTEKAEFFILKFYGLKSYKEA